MKNRNGWAIFWLVPLIVVLTIIIVVVVNFIQNQVDKNTIETVETDMLRIQAKAKIVFEQYHIDKEKGLAGEKIEDIEDYKEFGLEENQNYFKWGKNVLEEQNLNIDLEENDYYIINYDSEEVIYSAGYKAKDGNTYYKLSDIKNLGEEF